jgi:hypothetical protein
VERQGSNKEGIYLVGVGGKCTSLGRDSDFFGETERRDVIQVGVGMENDGVVLGLSMITLVTTKMSTMYD